MKKRIFISIALIVVLMLSLGLTGCQKAENQTEGQAQEKSEPAAESKSAEKLKIGFIFVGAANDGGWSEAHNNGRLALENAVDVETIYKESVPEGPEAEKEMRNMIDQGAKVIFATSFGYMDYVKKVANEFPDVKFFHCSGYEMGDNMSNYFGRIYEPRYLSGIVAGMKTKSNKIGYVAAFEIPEVVRGIDAFTLGVRSVNPNATVNVVWTHTWYDPAKEKEAAKALLEQNCDVIAQHQDSAGPQQAAEEKGVWAIGYDMPSEDKAPNAYMTAPIWNWGQYYIDQVKAIMDGTWKSESYWGGLNEGIVELAPLTKNAPEEAKAKVEEVAAKMKDGSFKVFAGSIKDQEGNIKVEEGKELTDGEKLSLDWFVEGVVGKIEKE